MLIHRRYPSRVLKASHEAQALSIHRKLGCLETILNGGSVKMLEKDVAEIKRLEAEAEKLAAERQKIDTERKGLEKRFNTPFFRSRLFVQAIIAGLVAIPMIWFYFNNIILPLNKKENIALSLKLQEKERYLDIYSKKLLIQHKKIIKDEIEAISSINSMKKEAISRDNMFIEFIEYSKSIDLLYTKKLSSTRLSYSLKELTKKIPELSQTKISEKLVNDKIFIILSSQEEKDEFSKRLALFNQLTEQLKASRKATEKEIALSKEKIELLSHELKKLEDVDVPKLIKNEH